MTTLFNLFCPLVLCSIEVSVLMMLTSIMLLLLFMPVMVGTVMSEKPLIKFSASLFSSSALMLYALNTFMTLGLLNMSSLMIFSYPITTTLSFNLSLAFMLWLSSILINLMKPSTLSSLLPNNSPWYLAPFLAIIELISLMVRPITLCFRLLANMSAGHILLSLMCKMPYLTWTLGSVFGVLELIVSLVQAFVFTMLVLVYFEESLTH